jgi:hypothetical protein
MNPFQRFAALLCLALGLAAPAFGGNIVVTFDDLGYPNGSYDPGASFPAGPAPGSGSYDNGWDLNGGFTSNGVFFSNSYDTTFNAWSGWGYSNVNDPTKTGPIPNTNDYIHQFAAITGAGVGGSGNYGIFTSGDSSGAPNSFLNLPSGTSPISLEVTNSTYTYLSMVCGDGFAKQFGAGDFLVLKIFGYSGLGGTGSVVGEVDFDLANYTSSSSLPVDVWSLVDLSSLAGARSLSFGFTSSDVGPFGINTPLSFAMDDLTLGTNAVPEPPSVVLALAGFGIAGLAISRRRRQPIATR